MILLDTSILIEYFRKQRKDLSYFYTLAGLGIPLGISSITKYEILIGKKPKQEAFWKMLFDNLTLLPFGDDEATEAATIQQYLLKTNQIIGFGDIAIGATAKTHKLKLATLNLKHFERIPGLELAQKS